MQKPERCLCSAPLTVLTSHLVVMVLWKTLLVWMALCQAHCSTQSGKRVMYCAGEAGMPQCHCGMVSHYLGAENRRAGLLCYAIAADCITEGKGDVRRMKCSHIKNAASLFPLTCGCVWQVFSMSYNRFLQRQLTCLIISLCVHLCIGIFSLFKD